MPLQALPSGRNSNAGEGQMEMRGGCIGAQAEGRWGMGSASLPGGASSTTRTIGASTFLSRSPCLMPLPGAGGEAFLSPAQWEGGELPPPFLVSCP